MAFEFQKDIKALSWPLLAFEEITSHMLDIMTECRPAAFDLFADGCFQSQKMS